MNDLPPSNAFRTPKRRFGSALVALTLGLSWLNGCADSETVPSGQSTTQHATQDTTQSSNQARLLITKLAKAVNAGDAATAQSLGSPELRSTLRAMVANARLLGLTNVRMRFVEATATDTQRFTGAVEVSYRLPVDSRTTTVQTSMGFAERNGRVRLDRVSAEAPRMPLWMSGPVQSRHTSRTLVITTGGRDLDTLSTQAERAVSQVNRVLPQWRGSLVIEYPRTGGSFSRLVGASRSEYAGIAAVTTSVDGSTNRGTPVHVYLNPTVFDPVRPKGRQVVLTHEATHVATGATFTAMPEWLLEGFADYVALANADVPVDKAAAQALKRLRERGLPTRLPTAADLAPTAADLGATYEQAWLATRFLAEEYGQQRLVDFYDAVAAKTPVAQAFRDKVGVSQEQFVRSWRANLRHLMREQPSA